MVAGYFKFFDVSLMVGEFLWNCTIIWKKGEIVPKYVKIKKKKDFNFSSIVIVWKYIYF